MPARFIDIEGIDQSGKKTQTRLLSARLWRQGFKVATLSFPVYNTPAGREIRAFLDGKRNHSLQAVHMLYSLNRWENKDKICRGLQGADFLVADRYSPSNWAYGLARGLDLDWLVGLDEGLPRPSTVILLDVPVRASFSRKLRQRDLHEGDRLLLRLVRNAYLNLARRFRWHVVNGRGDPETVHTEVWKALGLDRVKTGPKTRQKRH